MRKLPLIFSIILVLTSTVSANAMYECSLLDEGQTYAQMIKYENKFVEIFPTGEVEEELLEVHLTCEGWEPCAK